MSLKKTYIYFSMTLVTTAFGIRYEHLVLNNNILYIYKKKIRMYDKALIKKTRQFLTTLMKIYQIYRIKNGVSNITNSAAWLPF